MGGPNRQINLSGTKWVTDFDGVESDGGWGDRERVWRPFIQEGEIFCVTERIWFLIFELLFVMF